jgi:molybdopterin molybdotransferase
MALLPVAEARARILAKCKPLPTEMIPLAESYGRVLAKDLKASRDQPPFIASAMDGYAVRHADLGGALPTLKLVGVAAAGHGYRATLRPGQTVRILTGAPLPKGADTIVIQENTVLSDNALTVLEAPAPGKNLRARGLDFKRGDILVPGGTVMNARDIGLAAAGNLALVPVFCRPRLVLFTTGDELILPGEKPRADQIVSSNSHAIAAMARALGAEVINLGIVPDGLKATKAAIRKAHAADILVTTGGASVGDHDYVQQALRESGVDIDFWKIAMRPGKPFMFGRKGKQSVLGLPGNPVSALVCATLFLRPLIVALQGRIVAEQDVQARLVGTLPENDGRQDYLRATLQLTPDGQRQVKSFATQDSSMQRTLRNADCLIVRPAHAPLAQNGDLVPVLLLDF